MATGSPNERRVALNESSTNYRTFAYRIENGLRILVSDGHEIAPAKRRGEPRFKATHLGKELNATPTPEKTGSHATHSVVWKCVVRECRT